MARETATDIGRDDEAAEETSFAGVCATIPDGSEERENAGDAGEQADVAKTISRVRGGAVCHPDTIIRLKTCPANGFDRISGWPAFSAKFSAVRGAWRPRERSFPGRHLQPTGAFSMARRIGRRPEMQRKWCRTRRKMLMQKVN